MRELSKRSLEEELESLDWDAVMKNKNGEFVPVLNENGKVLRVKFVDEKLYDGMVLKNVFIFNVSYGRKSMPVLGRCKFGTNNELCYMDNGGRLFSLDEMCDKILKVWNTI